MNLNREPLPTSQQTQAIDRVLAAARIALGLYWLYEQHWKLPPDFGLHDPRGLMFAFQQSIQYPTVGLYRTFLVQIVVPHFRLFGWSVFLAESSVGMLLFVGLFSKLAALLGTLQAINLLVSQGATPEGPWIYLAILAANLVILLTPSNRVWSVDHFLGNAVGRMAGSHPRLARALAVAMGQ